jgi:MraZ protein
MFRGSSSHTCDPKGRLIAPSRFRDVIKTGGGGDKIILTTSMTSALSAYTVDEWKKVEAKLVQSKSANASAIRRFFLGNSQECNCDKQGRILIPKSLRDYAEIQKDIMLVGLIDHFEIWSLEKWEIENQRIVHALNAGDFKDELADLGI